MKYILPALFCVIITMAALPAIATPVNRDQANEYFAQCIKGLKKGSPKSMHDLCACTSARVMTAITAEELAASSQKTPEGQFAFKKVLTDVYAPCTELVAKDMFDFECVNNKKLYELNKGFDIPSVCNCAAQITAEWYQGKGTTTMTESLQRDPAMTMANPMYGVVSNPKVKSQNLNNLIACSAKPAAQPAPAAAAPAPATPAAVPTLSPTPTAPAPATLSPTP